MTPTREGTPDGTPKLRRHEISALADELAGTTLEQRIEMPGMKRSRADLLPAGAVIVEALVDELDVDEMQICDWGLREGVVLEAMGLARVDDDA